MSSRRRSWPLRIGLTGGICSGKSQAQKAFEHLGITVIDTDVLARKAVVPGSEGLQGITAEFGPGLLTSSGELDRQQLRQIIFSDSERRRRLESILHPLIRQAMLAEVEIAASAYVVLAIPLLFEADWQELVDRTLLIDCPEALQLTRLQQRDGVSAEQARVSLNSQMSRQQRIARADDCLLNEGSLAALEEQIEDLHQRYLQLAGSR